ncbi:MAG: OmpA family protein [Flavobacteriales bacterium]
MKHSKRFHFFAPALVALLMGGISTVVGQHPAVQRADRYAEAFRYSKAIQAYKAVPKKKQDAYVLQRLGECYLATHQSDKAVLVFSELKDRFNIPSEALIPAAQSQLQQGQYAEAQGLFAQAANAGAEDSRVQLYASNPEWHKQILDQENLAELTNLNINSSESDFGATYWGEKNVFVSSRSGNGPIRHEYAWNQLGFLNLYSAIPHSTKSGKLKQVKALKMESGLNRKFHEGPASFQANGQLMAFSRNTYRDEKRLNTEQGRVLEIWFSPLTDDGQWRQPRKFPFNHIDYNNSNPCLSPDGQRLYFVSDMPGGFGQSDIYVCQRDRDGNWLPPVNAGPGINTPGRETFPFFHSSGVLFFASDGHPGLGGLDLFVAVNNGLNSDRPIHLGPGYNSSHDDFALILNESLSEGYLSSNRPGGKGNDDVYHVRALQPIQPVVDLKGVVVDAFQHQRISNALIRISNEKGHKIAEVRTDQDGLYTARLTIGSVYSIEVMEPNYQTLKEEISTKNGQPELEVKHSLKKDLDIPIICTIKDKRSGLPLPGVKLSIVDRKTGESIANLTTTATGSHSQIINNKTLYDSLKWDIRLEKTGYVPKQVAFNHTIKDKDPLKLHELADVSMGRLEVGADIGAIIEIKPIFFEVGSAAITPQASLELDKIIEILKEFPGMTMELASHTDCQGPADANQTLSVKRAKSAAAYMQKKGISSKRIQPRGYGEYKPQSYCGCGDDYQYRCTEEENALNRRTEFLILKME